MLLRLKFVWALLFLLAGCAPTRIIEPLQKGEQEMSISLGGPIASNGPVPILPLGTISYARGMGNDFALSAGLNITSLIFGTLYIDPAFHWAHHFQNIPRLGMGAKIGFHGLVGFRDGSATLTPELSPYLFWRKDKSTFYTGLENWININRIEDDDETQNPWLLSINAGVRWNKPKWKFQIELKYNGLNVISETNVLGIRPLQIRERGALGLYFGLSRRLGDQPIEK